MSKQPVNGQGLPPTGGDWKAEVYDGNTMRVIAYMPATKEMPTPSKRNICTIIHPHGDDEAAANALLLSAAKDLRTEVEILIEAMLNKLDDLTFVSNEMAQVSAAIRKSYKGY